MPSDVHVAKRVVIFTIMHRRAASNDAASFFVSRKADQIVRARPTWQGMLRVQTEIAMHVGCHEDMTEPADKYFTSM
jgi:hypothetical protein